MIEYLTTIANRVFWLKPLMGVLTVFFTGLFASVLLTPGTTSNDVYIIPSILGFMWSLMFFVLVYLFPDVPTTDLSKLGFFKKIKVKIHRFFLHILGLIFFLLTAAVIFMTIRMFLVWWRNY